MLENFSNSHKIAASKNICEVVTELLKLAKVYVQEEIIFD
jgi:hypothetical protein